MNLTTIFVLIAILSILNISYVMIPIKNANAWHERTQLPAGTYTINGNGFMGELSIFNTNGRIEGNVFGDRIIGFWNDVTHTIIFMRMGNPSNPFTFQVYEGYMFMTTERNPSTGALLCYSNFAGEFLTPGGGGGSPQRFEYGWFARTQFLCP
jgi:hypothetical protein